MTITTGRSTTGLSTGRATADLSHVAGSPTSGECRAYPRSPAASRASRRVRTCDSIIVNDDHRARGVLENGV
jgi:hypothetical protein